MKTKKLLILNASPRKKGNISQMVTEMANEAMTHGVDVDVEVRTATGRVDMVLCTAQKLYLFELKLNRSAEAAMQQIDLKNYPARFALCGLPVVKVGIQFDAEKHTLSEWQIEA